MMVLFNIFFVFFVSVFGTYQIFFTLNLKFYVSQPPEVMRVNPDVLLQFSLF